MNDYISKEATIDAIKKIYCPQCDNYNGVMCWACEHMDDMEIIEDMPAANVQPVKHGRWIGIYEYCEKNGCVPSGMGIYYWCSECDKAEQKTSDFCPNCGARMDGDAE